MGFELVIEPEAQKEIQEAVEWYESKQAGLGADFLNYLGGYFQTLKNGKATFEIKRNYVFRELPLKRFPFVIIYEEIRNQIIIYSVFNTFQNPSKKKR
jgi:hypothetical protein